MADGEGLGEIAFESDFDFARPQFRAALRDGRLSWGARGLFAFLWDLPRGWRLNSLHLSRMGKDGRDATRARLKELEKVGALRRETLRDPSGRVSGRRWVVVSADRWAVAMSLGGLPASGFPTESREIRLSANPAVGKPAAKVHQASEGSPSKKREESLAAALVEKNQNYRETACALARLASRALNRYPKTDQQLDAECCFAAVAVAAKHKLVDSEVAAAVSSCNWPREAVMLIKEMAEAAQREEALGRMGAARELHGDDRKYYDEGQNLLEKIKRRQQARAET